MAFAPCAFVRAARVVRTTAEGLGLVLVLTFVLAVTYLPHLDPPRLEGGEPALVTLAQDYGAWTRGAHQDYPFPVHVDEHAHWVFMSALQREHTLKYRDPYTGGPRVESALSLKGLVHETGFHVAVSQFQEFTGIDWVQLFRWLPSIWMGVTAVALWAALRPSPGALPAAALVALAPTSVRFLGPGFLVPIGFSMAWVAGALLLLSSPGRGARTSVLLLAITLWAFFIHLIAGFAVLGAVFLNLPFAARRNRKEAFVIGAVALIPLMWLAAAFLPDFQREAGIFNFLPIDFSIFDQMGIPFLLTWIAACGLAVMKPPARGRGLVYTCVALSILTLAMIVVNVTFDIRRYALYDRWHQLFLLFGAVPVGHAIGVVGQVAGRQLRRLGRRALPGLPRARSAVSAVLAVVVSTASLAYVSDQGVGYHIDTPYYRVTYRQEVQDYRAAGLANETYQVFLTHPWKAPIYIALTGKIPFTVLHPGEPPFRGQEYNEYLAGKYADGVWLAERDITQVLDDVTPVSPDYEVLGPHDARLSWPLAHKLAEVRSE